MTHQSDFRPAWWLPGPHLPTIYGKLLRRVPPAGERIERWDTPDGDSVSVARVDAARAEAPILAILHGLEGTVRSTYAQALMHEARQRGWGAAMLIFRTCDGRVPAAPRMYHSGETTDTDLFLRRLAAEQPGRPIVVVGVSLGANVLLKWLGEQGTGVPPELRAAAAVSTPFDLAEGSAHLNHGFSRVYVRHFVRQLQAKALKALQRHPTLPVVGPRMLAARSFWEFDDAFTAPVHGFAGADDYYARSSSLPFLDRVRVPTLLFSAENDPFLPRQVLDRVRTVAAANPALHPSFTGAGGHVGWVGGSPFGPTYFMESHVTSWLSAFA
ncbi:MAG: alpha/beta fold hydrolase [Gemmatimonadaceae bacterium]|nr:alpha/beta fold hydrolase [Gemmatimonadaceae bacterium]